jgi:hypothetical protein
MGVTTQRTALTLVKGGTALPQPESRQGALTLSDLHPDVVHHLEGQDQKVVKACLFIAGYVSRELGVNASQLQPRDLIDYRVVQAIHQHVAETHDPALVSGARKLMRSLGDKALFPSRHYEAYHPAVLEWKEALKHTRTRVTSQGTYCMYFLTWLHERELHYYPVHEIPLSHIRRKHLLDFRQHLAERAYKKNITLNSARTHLIAVISWIRWLGDNRLNSPVGTIQNNSPNYLNAIFMLTR